MAESLEPRVETYIATRIAGARNVRVSNLNRIAGGASRETFRFLLSYDDDSGPVERKLILRRDMPSSLIDTIRKVEYEAYRAFANTKVPVPEMLWLEEDVDHLGLPFFIAEEIAGFQADTGLLQTDAYRDQRASIGRQKWALLGEIAQIDPQAIGYHALFDPPAPQDVWHIQLDYWAGVLDNDAIRPEPVIRAVIRWMRRNPPPPPPKLSVVHGDYRTGNFLYDREGNVRAILDWEMTHIGDPLEDIGWSLNRLWCFAKDDLRGGLLRREEAITAWESTSGMTVDPVAMHWWELFASVKGQGIWVSAGENAINAQAKELIHFGTAWSCMNSQDRDALELMGR